MNPIAYCAVASCSDKDWEVFGAFALITIGGLILVAGLTWLIEKFRKEKNMK